MSCCGEVERLLTPYVDGEASAVEREAVAGHLAACARCRRRVTAEALVRRTLRARAAALCCDAPDGLRARCLALRRR